MLGDTFVADKRVQFSDKTRRPKPTELVMKYREANDIKDKKIREQRSGSGNGCRKKWMRVRRHLHKNGDGKGCRKAKAKERSTQENRDVAVSLQVSHPIKRTYMKERVGEDEAKK